MNELKQLLSYVRPHAPKVGLSVLLMAIVGASHGLVAVLIEPVFDRILNPDTAPGPIRVLEIPFVDKTVELGDLLPSSLDDVWTMIAAAILGVFIIKGICDFFGNYLINYAGLAGVRDLRNHVYQVVLNQSPAFFQTRHTGKLISSLVNDIERIQVALSHILADLLRQGFIVIALLWVLIQTDWRLALVSLTVLPAVLIPTSRIGRRIRSTTRRAQDDLGDLTQILHETIEGNRVVKAFGMEAYEEGRFRAAADRLFRSNLRYVRQQAIASPLIEVFGALTIVVLLSYVRQQEMTAGQFTTFVVALLMLYQPVKRLNGIYNIFQQALGSSQRVFEYLAHPHDVAESPSAADMPPFSRNIVFEDVSFHYPEHDNEPTLRDIDLTVNAGEVVAIVGPSGAGKSTLLNLLPRFFDPTAGRILIDGNDLTSLKLSSLRSQIAVVTQETFLFDETVFNNIAYGQPNTPREQVVRAAQAAIAADFIEAMPDGYETHLGERGYRLSGGQRQRISIARALLKDAPILLLDEATSHLDTESEMLVQQALGNLMKGRTVIVVAHRLSTIRSADKIVVVEDGKIVDIGKHDRLLASSPVYQRLFELQSADKLDQAPLPRSGQPGIGDYIAWGEALREKAVGPLAQGEYPNEPRTIILLGYMSIADEHHRAISSLLSQQLYGSGFALVRSLYEAFVRFHWVSCCASEAQVDKITKKVFEFPSVSVMSESVDASFGTSPFFSTIKKSNWSPMNDYTHGGLRQLARRFNRGQVQTNYDEAEIREVVSAATTMMLMLCRCLAVIAASEDAAQASEDALNEFISSP